MRLFLASYRFGAHADRLAALAGPPGRVAVIANACDAWPRARAAAVTSDLVPLRTLGYRPEEVDLREYAGRAKALAQRLAEFPMVWVRGGNTFVLRAQFARSGADLVIPELLAADALVYAGYSAGACVLAPDLHGLETADDPAEVLPACGVEPRWDGLGLIDRPIVPHIDSATDPDGDGNRLAAAYRAAGVEHWALTDDDVVVVDGDAVRLFH
ncbi:Type 1 glutamine amidotransferase-like domain-containing protein [Nocardia cyriacigeorgica]|uniref:Type 1 glutamine amidotransferase-like domain-containing protein n=1 Tax=Nocardia cyriacigeorgica TaxID=135487 RepID=UPI0013D6D386|nr:Type 1 glutamine amidotransferase-like domain-containing protein [Nocardia cyriacigeorgica]MBF6457292.1 Type 1 glutamine amidotransferase-like domain-containing protein [Nocardia cyriacigeorgica]MBF6478833.1 Type 1 glutamine amidotransferase-like domain-containing protein [Nocardia cyriacigeorgica]MBF6554475.1 Type 1 glutamine amidotransferase-like domain-containing protein [Nocardia cyriacigeorgica]NEW27879.1 type 1 glutamine amidotransferase-like domain-containing protein [Nocardia cyriaci